MLARSATLIQVDSKTPRADLIKLTKEALSLEEIENRLHEVRRSQETSAFHESIYAPGRNGQLLLALLMMISLNGYSGLYVNPTLSSFLFASNSFVPLTNLTTIVTGSFIFTFFYLAFTLGIRTSLVRMAYKFELSKVGAIAILFGFATTAIGFANFVLRIIGATVEPAPYFFFLQPQPYFRLTFLGVALQITLSALMGLTVASTGMFLAGSHKRISRRKIWISTGVAYLCAGALVITAALSDVILLAGGSEITEGGSLAVACSAIVSALGIILTAIAAFLGVAAFSRP